MGNFRIYIGTFFLYRLYIPWIGLYGLFLSVRKQHQYYIEVKANMNIGACRKFRIDSYFSKEVQYDIYL